MEISSTSTSFDEGEILMLPQNPTASHQLVAVADQGSLNEQDSEQQGPESRTLSPETNKSRPRGGHFLAQVPISEASEVVGATSSDHGNLRPENLLNMTIKEEIRSPLTTQAISSQSGNSLQGAVSSAPIVLDDDEDDYEPPESISPTSPVGNDAMSVKSFSPPPPEAAIVASSQPAQQSELQTISDSAPTNNEAPQNLEIVQQFETIEPEVQEVGLPVACTSRLTW